MPLTLPRSEYAQSWTWQRGPVPQSAMKIRRESRRPLLLATCGHLFGNSASKIAWINSFIRIPVGACVWNTHGPLVSRSKDSSRRCNNSRSSLFSVIHQNALVSSIATNCSSGSMAVASAMIFAYTANADMAMSSIIDCFRPC